MPDSLHDLVRALPWLTLVAAALLGLRLHRARIALAAAVVAMVWAQSAWWAERAGWGEDERAPAVRAAAAIGTLALLALAVLPERPLTSSRGKARAIVLLSSPLLVAAVGRPAGALAPWLHADPLGVAWPGCWALGDLALFVLLPSAIAFAAIVVRRAGAVESGIAAAALSLLLALNAAGDTIASPLFCAVAGIVLLFAAVETTHSMAYRDELTGLPGRRALNEALAAQGESWTFAMVDVDHFKKFNDTHGHDVGDQVLRLVASRLARVSGGGRAYRYGGEEFSVLFPGRARAEALPHIENLRASIEEAKLTIRAPNRPAHKPKKGAARRKTGDPTVSVTVSIGVAELGSRLHTSDQVLKAADQALYRAKEAGRNRVM